MIKGLQGDFIYNLDSVLIGFVSSFDEKTGLGEITAKEINQKFKFHAVCIKDASRSIEIGSPVCFKLKPGPEDIMTASEIIKLNEI
jgi:cold shock CspA family protein